MARLNIPKKYKIKTILYTRIYNFLGYRRTYNLRTKFKYCRKIRDDKTRYHFVCQLLNFNGLGLALIKLYYKSFRPGKGSHMLFFPKSNLFKVWSRKATKPRLHKQLKTNNVIFQFNTIADVMFFMDKTTQLGLAPHIIYPLYMLTRHKNKLCRLLPFFKHRKIKLKREQLFEIYIITIFRQALKNSFYFYYNKLLYADPPDIRI